jgi:succinate dehydrogenase / fumarate reductase membrane anchor subunit
MKFTTDRKRAEGMGSGREGTLHHWHMILSSIALCFAVPVFVITFGLIYGGSRAEVLAYLGKPFPAIAIGVTLVIGILHFRQEIVEAVEDYVHGIPGKLTLFATTAFTYLLIAVALFAIAKIAL